MDSWPPPPTRAVKAPSAWCATARESVGRHSGGQCQWQHAHVDALRPLLDGSWTIQISAGTVKPMPAVVLVLNAGSSTLKYQVVDPASGTASVRGAIERIGGPDVRDHAAALDTMQGDLADHGITAAHLVAVGHRVVHGGPRLVAPTVVDDDVLAEIEDLARLAPLHNPPAAAGIRTARDHFPDVPQVAVFDTAYFADLPAAAATYAVDRELA